ncbi:heterogeneous nuclear ribonucleoprotein L-like [Ochlerotatus camptorhynchus]|uniref:heterogeneous nuclear ribonucleoprotein L-like n=1 Tax=Ochlerotatus camptorhynchus TaxID=644619 RepID=UPI0031E4715A
MTRNGPANFIQPTQQQGAVMMVYGLGTDMVQMGDAIAVEPVERTRLEKNVQHLQEQSLPFPSKLLHFFNTPPGMSEDLLLTAFTTKDCHPSQVRMFPLKSERSSFGLIEFPGEALAMYAIMKFNHSAIDHKGTKFPFIMKLCFSSSNIRAVLMVGWPKISSVGHGYTN